MIDVWCTLIVAAIAFGCVQLGRGIEREAVAKACAAKPDHEVRACLAGRR